MELHWGFTCLSFLVMMLSCLRLEDMSLPLESTYKWVMVHDVSVVSLLVSLVILFAVEVV